MFRTFEAAFCEIGALHATHSAEQYEDDTEKDSFVVLREIDLRRNIARVGGGAIMASHPTTVLFACSHEVNPEEKDSFDLIQYYVDWKVMSDLQQLSEDKQCASWIGNRVEEGGYGDLKANHAVSALSAFRNPNKGSPTKQTVITRMDPVPELPPIDVTLSDAFGQSPAEPRTSHPDLVLKIRTEGVENGIEISGHLTESFSRGTAVLYPVIIRGKPGTYTLHLELSDTEIKSNSMRVEILPCPIGWRSVSDGTDCEKCEQGTYNFDEDSETCHICPDDSMCHSWGIEPNKKHWVPFPCHKGGSKKCLTESVCDHGEHTSRKIVRQQHVWRLDSR